MTKKQIKKLVNQLVEQELIHADPSSTKEQKSQAENRIIQLSGMLACLPNGLELMTEIDFMIQEKLADKNKKEKEVNNNGNET